MKKRIIPTLPFCLLFLFSFSLEKTGNLSQVAANAINPIAQVIKFMLQPKYYMYNNGGNAINPICTLDWQNGNYTFPVALGFGKAFGKNLSTYIMPEYVVSGPTKKTLIIQFNLNAMF